MNLLISDSSDPYQNLATEEYLLKNSQEKYLFLYINRPCVVIGKHQIVTKEINSRYTSQNNILIARRLTGGGAVYHDEGNLNFSFIQSTATNENISYKSITQDILSFLKNLGVAVTLSKRNDILSNGLKVSGSAMHLYKQRVLAHGTLLINSNLENLSLSIRSNRNRFTDKSIASVPSQVGNVGNSTNKLNAQLVSLKIEEFFEALVGPRRISILPAMIRKEVQELASNKYASLQWIYGYSPKYIYEGQFTIASKLTTYKLQIEKGIIEQVNINSKNELFPAIESIMNSLIGNYHNITTISNLFSNFNLPEISQIISHSLF